MVTMVLVGLFDKDLVGLDSLCPRTAPLDNLLYAKSLISMVHSIYTMYVMFCKIAYSKLSKWLN